ncbi:MAG: TM2 domain-containing protein [Candidatus Woesearchaeota archaeon]
MTKKNDKKERNVYVNVHEVNWVVTLIMSIIFGWLGVDRFIMGKVGTGLLKLFTLGGLGVWWLVDLILIATKHQYKNVKWIE